MEKIKVAILGATGHIAKNIICGLNQKQKYQLGLFARRIDVLEEFQRKENLNSIEIQILKFSELENYHFDVIINCIGIGDPTKLKKMGGAIFTLTEEFDNLVLNYLNKINRDTLYINFSSGIAYGSNYSTPASQNKAAIININQISPTDYYTISKINTEAKHRSFNNLNIVDLRVFGFFSKFVDLKTPYFLSDIVNSVKANQVFYTGNNEMTRDYIHPDDLLQLIEKCINTHYINDVFDVYSREPITKFQIINYFQAKYNLEVSIENEKIITSITGVKSNYYSLNKKSDLIGYSPKYSSLEAIISQLSYLI